MLQTFTFLGCRQNTLLHWLGVTLWPLCYESQDVKTGNRGNCFLPLRLFGSRLLVLSYLCGGLACLLNLFPLVSSYVVNMIVVIVKRMDEGKALGSAPGRKLWPPCSRICTKLFRSHPWGEDSVAMSSMQWRPGQTHVWTCGQSTHPKRERNCVTHACCMSGALLRKSSLHTLISWRRDTVSTWER